MQTNILIVEDDLIQLNILEETIKKAYPTWEICTAQNFDMGNSLIQESVTNPIPFTLFLFDIQPAA